MREIKFRAWDKDKEEMFYCDGLHYWAFFNSPNSIGYGLYHRNDGHRVLSGEYNPPVMQYTGLKDKNGKEIYEGDIVKRVRLEIEYQTHYGDNIPLGSYTEPIGVIAKNELAVVEFRNGEFTIVDSDVEEDDPMNAYNWLRYPEVKDRRDVNYIFFPHYDSERSQKYSDEEFIEQMNYAADDLGIKPTSIDEFITMINGVKVIGNIYENSELLKS